MRKLIVAVFVSVVFSSVCLAQTKVGISLHNIFDYERWNGERDAMVALLKADGFSVLVEEADFYIDRQASQIRGMAAKGAKVIIVVAEDGKYLAPIVDELAALGVKVIAYERPIPTASVAAYVSFDHAAAGRFQAQGVLSKIGPDRVPDIHILCGSPLDPVAHLIRSGQTEILMPLRDRGKIRIVADYWVEGGDPGNAEKLIQYTIQKRKARFDAIMASDDGIALGAIETLSDYGLAGKIPVSGMGATAAACNSIARGELTMTVLEDGRLLPIAACDIAGRFARGEAVSGLVSRKISDFVLDSRLAADIPCLLLTPTPVTKESMKILVVDTGYRSYDEVYAGAENPPPR